MFSYCQAWQAVWHDSTITNLKIDQGPQNMAQNTVGSLAPPECWLFCLCVDFLGNVTLSQIKKSNQRLFPLPQISLDFRDRKTLINVLKGPSLIRHCVLSVQIYLECGVSSVYVMAFNNKELVYTHIPAKHWNRDAYDPNTALTNQTNL